MISLALSNILALSLPGVLLFGSHRAGSTQTQWCPQLWAGMCLPWISHPHSCRDWNVDRTGGIGVKARRNGSKWHQKKFRLDIKKKKVTERVFKHWNSEGVESLILEISKKCEGGTSGHVFVVDLEELSQCFDSVVLYILGVFSNLNNSMLTADGFLYTHSIGWCTSSGRVLKAKGARPQTLWVNVAMNLGELHKTHRNPKLPSVPGKRGAVRQLSSEIKWCCMSGVGPSSSSGLYLKCKKWAHQNMCTDSSIFCWTWECPRKKTKSFQFSLFITRNKSKSKWVSTCLWILQEVWLSFPGAPWGCCHRPCSSHS